MKFSGVIAAFSLGSAFAAPVVQKKDTPLDSITSLVSGLKVDVVAQLANIPVVGTVEASAVPLVQAALADVLKTVQGVTSQVTPLVFSVVVPTVDSEAQGVLTAVTDLKDTVTGIQTTVKGLVGVASSDVLSTLKPEIQSVLNAAGTLVTPVTTLAFQVINALPAGSIVTTELTSLVGDIQGVLNLLLAPVDDILGGLLSL